MFILTEEPLTWLTVRVPRLDEAGEPAEQTLRVKVVLVDYDRYTAMTSTTETTPEEERALLRELVRDWDGVVTATKQPVPFSPEGLNAAMQQPMFIGAFFTAYFRGWSGRVEEREGNSNASPAGGPASGSPVPKTTPAGDPATQTSSA